MWSPSLSYKNHGFYGQTLSQGMEGGVYPYEKLHVLGMHLHKYVLV